MRTGPRDREGGWRGRLLLPLACLLLALAISGTGLSNATYEAASSNPGSALSAAADWVPPLVSIADPGAAVRGTIQLGATASDPYGSGVSSVRFERAAAGSGNWVAVCTDTTVPYGCPFDTTTLSNDYYDFRAVAADAAGFTSSDQVSDVQLDNRAPNATMLDPGSPLSGVVTLAAEASDADSSVASVTIQRSAAGKGLWAEVCTSTSTPYGCRFDTRTVAEGTYDFRAVATDVAGNATASSIVGNRRIDNTVSSVSLDDPGAYLRGTVTLSANASSTAGVASVSIQRSAAGKAVWTEICRPTASPYNCAWSTATVADGSYDLRAVMTTGSGSVLSSQVVAARQVDNTPVRGLDLQAFNRVGGSAGRIESGDSLAFTYSEQMSPGSILPGWSGAAVAPVYVRLRDGNLLGTGSSGDALQFSSDASGSNPLRLGSVNLHSDFVKTNKTSTFAATLSLSNQLVEGAPASVVTVTVGSLVSGGALRTSSLTAQMVWTPSASATDLSGNACSTAPVAESGALDRDF